MHCCVEKFSLQKWSDRRMQNGWRIVYVKVYLLSPPLHKKGVSLSRTQLLICKSRSEVAVLVKPTFNVAGHGPPVQTNAQDCNWQLCVGRCWVLTLWLAAVFMGFSTEKVKLCAKVACKQASFAFVLLRIAASSIAVGDTCLILACSNCSGTIVAKQMVVKRQQIYR
jgi:hypothetical protein